VGVRHRLLPLVRLDDRRGLRCQSTSSSSTLDLRARSLASVEDILFDEGSGRLYAAGVLGTVPGIYRIDVASNVLPS
jgi:hypothetical protein